MAGGMGIWHDSPIDDDDDEEEAIEAASGNSWEFLKGRWKYSLAACSQQK